MSSERLRSLGSQAPILVRLRRRNFVASAQDFERPRSFRVCLAPRPVVTRPAMLQVPTPEPAAPLDESSPQYRGWRVVIACFTIAMFAWGFGFYGHGVFLAELREARGWPASLISGATTLYYFVGALAVIYVSDAVRRFGPRAVMLAGVVLIAAAALAVGIVVAPWQLYAVYLLMSAGWAATTVGAISNVLGLWFSGRRGLAMNLALNGAS